jgi:arginyl-tRNA synthetase
MGRSIRERIEVALAVACRAVGIQQTPPVIVEKPRRGGHGDLSTNLALLLSRERGEDARELAERLAGKLSASADVCPSLCDKIEIAGGGFINFFLSPRALREELARILREGERYGTLTPGKPLKIQLEFVSANPTGPLTVAHGRQAAVGDSLARILTRAGHSVTREYYLNDAGAQIRLLGLSTLIRYREFWGGKADIPSGGYQGGYVKEIAGRVRQRESDRWLRADEEEAVNFFTDIAVAEIMARIREDLEDFRVRFDHWTSEKEFARTGKIEECLAFLDGKGFVYERDGAVWFRSSALGDDKDRVLVKSDGQRTYFTPDIAYHREKFAHGFDRVIDFWGPDHHGYLSRMRAAVEALGYDRSRFTPVIVQLTTLFRGTQKLSMSTRAGEFITLREVMDEVGVDAARYFCARMKVDSHLNFDLELAKERSQDNPVYYVQYVHARVCSMFKRLGEKKPGFTLPPWDRIALDALGEDEELNLMKILADFPTVVERSTEALEPNLVCNYLEDLAAAFHQCYTRHTVISEDAGLTAARLALAEAVRLVVRIGLDCLGVAAPERM